MGEQKTEKTKKHICAGLLAHVDAGKTTLTESLLYARGATSMLPRSRYFWYVSAPSISNSASYSGRR